MLELRFICPLEHGIHARPASRLSEVLRPFTARVEIVKESSGSPADGRSVLSVVALDIALGDACMFRVAGEHEAEAMAALRDLVQRGFGEAASAPAEAAAAVASATNEARIPEGLRRLGTRWIAGRSISPGFAQGPVRLMRSQATTDDRPAGAQEDERAAVRRAMGDVRRDLESRLGALHADGSELERDLLRAHVSIADDPSLRERIDEHIRDGASANAAVRKAGEFFKQSLQRSHSQYIRDRVLDVEDVCQQILEHLINGHAGASIALDEPSILVADLLTPRHMLALDRTRVRALVLGGVGATSHTAILARAFGIPTLIDVDIAAANLAENQVVMVDADGGFVLPVCPREVERYYAIETRQAARRRQRLGPFITLPATTRDGARIEVAANISLADEVTLAMREGAEGVGLFRTEMLFLDRPAPPSEQEQFAAYSNAIEAAAGRTIIIRTFDIGGDKPAPYLRLEREDNPFLGFRGIRLYEQFADLLRSQLRAIVRASAHGPVKVMAPMVSNAAEAGWFVQRVREVQGALQQEGSALNATMPIGVMLEVPAAALAIDQLSAVVDFFSVGTNDLAQYLLAADRGNPRVAGLCDPLEPGFLRMLANIAEAAKRNSRWVGVCGEMAGDARHLPIMVGLGVDEISVAPARVLELKAALAHLDASECAPLLQQLIACRDVVEVRRMLAEFANQANAPDDGADSGAVATMIDTSLVLIGSDAASKVEAIKELVGLIISSGRASDAHALEQAIWAREDTFATNVGHGFAIPHCKSETLRAATIAVLHLDQGIDWGAAEGEPVRVAIMLAIPGGGHEAARQHMQMLAKLARQLMHEDFRELILQAQTAQEIVVALTTLVA